MNFCFNFFAPVKPNFDLFQTAACYEYCFSGPRATSRSTKESGLFRVVYKKAENPEFYQTEP